MDRTAKTHGATVTWSCQILILLDNLLEDIFPAVAAWLSAVKIIIPKRWLKPRLHMAICSVTVRQTTDDTHWSSKYLHRCFQIAVTPGIEKLTSWCLRVWQSTSLPMQFLSEGNGSSIWHLHRVDCDFHPTVSLGCLRGLTVLHLDCVRITGTSSDIVFPAVLLWSSWNSGDAPR